MICNKLYSTEKKGFLVFGIICAYLKLETTKTIPFYFKECITKENTMNIKILKAAIAGLVLSVSGFANAGLIYDNGPAIADSDRCAETSGTCNGTWTLFDDFIVSNDSDITSVTWTTNLYGGLGDYNSSNIWFYDNDPVFGSGNLLFSYSDAGTTVANALGGNFYDITLSGFTETLMAGTYWIGIQHNTTSNYATVAMSGTSVNATQWQNGGAGARISSQPELAFRINGNSTEVPEPSTLAIFALGIMGLASRRFKK